MNLSSVHLELTNHCNLACLMCPNKRMKRERTHMPFNLIRKIVEENPEIKAYGISNWGEPLLHPEFLKIIRYLTEQEKRFSLSTNATLLDAVFTAQLVQSSIEAIGFSVDAVGKEYEKIRGFPYSKVKQNILNFLLMRQVLTPRIIVKIVATVSKWNERTVQAVANEWLPRLPVVAQPALTYTQDDRTRQCGEFYQGHLVVLSNGVVVPCCVDYEGSLEIGNAYTHSLDKILNSDKLQNLRTVQNSICACCSEYQNKYVPDRFKKMEVPV